ncbi:MAG: AAA family ATPase [Succinivibrio sp.]|nr:AAA family ATPase [Succinatimonas sp.]MDD6376617.1 AAA family ATPase [Succinatimonas sp.]
MKFTKLLPNSCNFRDLIDNNRVYVDKTALICQIAKDEKGPYFISRPRRFGKSTLINTFHELFAHGTERFKGLEIEPLWKDKTYKVIHLDFSTFREVPSNSSFNKEFMDAFKLSLEEAGIEPTKENIDSPANLLKKTLDTESEVVLLVDEYDAPLTAVLNDSNEFEDRRKILSNFYMTVKSFQVKFRFIFITGVTYYAHTSIFSAFNNLTDLTLDSDYGALLGYTSEELEKYFSEYIDNAVVTLNKKFPTERYTHEKVVEELKRNYDGYSFDEDCMHHVYNPWSILNFLKSPHRGFIPYWVVSGGSTPTFLVNYLKQGLEKYNADELQSLLQIDSTVNKVSSKLYPTIDNIAKIDLFAILYQAGYFCIKGVNRKIFQIGIPNLEVKQAYSEIMLRLLTNNNDVQEKFTTSLYDILCENNLDKLKNIFNSFINELSYETVKNFNEACFRDVLKLAMLTFNVTAATEVMGACGRADITAEAGDYLYVFELKVTDNSKDIATKLNDAKAQIIKNKYARRLTDKTVVPVALVLENNSKSRDKSDTPVCEIVALEKV